MWSAEKIKALREAIGDTQREFAERLDLSMFTVRNWEQKQAEPGRRALRDLVELEKAWKEGRITVEQPA